MKVGLDCLLPGGLFGGVPRSVESLALALARPGDLELTCYVRNDYQGPLSGATGIVLHRLPALSGRGAGRVISQQILLPGVIRQDSPDLFHAPVYTAPLGSRMPLVLTIHDLFALSHPHLCPPANRVHFRMLLPPSASRAAAVIVPSDFVRRQVLDILGLPPEKVFTVPHGVDGIFRPNSGPSSGMRRRLGLLGRYILWVGRTEPRKDLPTLLAAWDELSRRGKRPPVLVLAGPLDEDGGPSRLRLEELRRRGELIVLGPVAEEDLPALYAGAELFVFPSLVEGFGLPPLEAMACGTPAVVSDGGALPEVVGDAAVIFRAGQADDLAACVERLLADDAERDRLTDMGLERARQFTWERAAELTRSVYSFVLERAAG